MVKPIPIIGSHKNKHIASRKSTHGIPKGVIHVQASFNNTVVTVTNVWGRVVSWSSINTCGFKGTRRGTPFVAQIVAKNAIQKSKRKKEGIENHLGVILEYLNDGNGVLGFLKL